MRDEKPYCKPGESDARFALGMTLIWGVITFVLGLLGIVSLF